MIEPIRYLWQEVRETIASRKLERQINCSLSRLKQAHQTAIRAGAVWYAEDNELVKAIENLKFAQNVMPRREHPIKLLYRHLRRPRQGQFVRNDFMRL